MIWKITKENLASGREGEESVNTNVRSSQVPQVLLSFFSFPRMILTVLTQQVINFCAGRAGEEAGAPSQSL